MKRLILLHCFGRTSQERWYQSVARELADFYTVETPDLPNPDLGKLDEWLPTLVQLKPDRQTFLVGHSLGGVLILRYLEQTAQPIAGFALVGAPINDLARNDLHETGFFERDFDWQKIKGQADQRFVIASADDDTVPFWQAEYLTNHLEAELKKFTDKGHFRQDDFPELVSLLKELA